VLSSAIGGSAADSAEWELSELPASFFDLAAADAKGAALDFSQFQGRPVLVVNVASQ
jgi:hypothetical protein